MGILTTGSIWIVVREMLRWWCGFGGGDGVGAGVMVGVVGGGKGGGGSRICSRSDRCSSSSFWT